MNKAYMAGMASGFLGGIVGAVFIGHLSLSSVIPRASAASSQLVVVAIRIRLFDPTASARARISLCPVGGPRSVSALGRSAAGGSAALPPVCFSRPFLRYVASASVPIPAAPTK